MLTQAGGRNPDQFIESVRPVIDIEKYYDSERLTGVIEALSMSQGQLEFIEVPEGEVWKLLSVAVHRMLPGGVGASSRFSFAIERLLTRGLNGTTVASSPNFDQAISGERFAFGWQPPQPILLTSAQRIVVSCDKATANNTGELHVVYVRMTQ